MHNIIGRRLQSSSLHPVSPSLFEIIVRGLPLYSIYVQVSIRMSRADNTCLVTTSLLIIILCLACVGQDLLSPSTSERTEIVYDDYIWELV